MPSFPIVRGWAFISVIAAIALVLAVGCGPTDDEKGGGPAARPGKSDSNLDRAGEPIAAAGSDLPVGSEVGGKLIIPNGRFISPLGNQIVGPRFISNMVLSPDGDYVYMISLTDRQVSVLDTETLSVIQNFNAGGTFNGIAINAAGDKLWVAGGGQNEVYEFTVTDGHLARTDTIRVWGYPTGLTLSPDESRLYVAAGYGNKVYSIDTSTGLIVNTWVAQNFPYFIALSPDGSRGFVTNWGSSSVTVFNTSNGQVIDNVIVGLRPEGIVFNNGLVFVACSDSDEIHVIDPIDLTVVDVIDVDPDEDVFGHMPTHMNAYGDRLYITSSGYNAITVIDTDTNDVIGQIPTGWYPMSVLLDEDAGVMYVGNAKGQGAGPGGGAQDQPGSISVFDLPDDADLAALTTETRDNNMRTAQFFTDLDFDSPIPTQRGVKSDQIKRVIFVMKENKTYDQVFGDLLHTNADPFYCIYCGDYTPNMHALAAQFTNADNFYSETEASLMGHMWSMAMVCNDFTEKAHKAKGVVGEIWTVQYGEQASKSGTIFHRLLEQGVPIRLYGQVANVITNMDELHPYVNLRYGFYNQSLSDETKISEVLNDFEKGLWPPLVYISIPNDHTDGGDPGKPKPGFMVADNDAALGKLVDYVSHSPYWNETAIFITEDDPQSGADHVDAHRTIGLVVSPWAKRGHVTSTFYSMSSMWLTIQLILGVDSLTIYDKNVAPMYDAFTLEPDFTPYDKIERIIPFELNPEDAAMREWADRQIWDVPDQVPNMGEITWKIMRPGEPFPFHASVDRVEEEEEEEGENFVEEYRELVRQWTDFARAQRIEPLKPEWPSRTVDAAQAVED